MGHLAMCVDIFGYHSWQRGAPDLDQLEAKGAAKHPTMHRMPPPNPHPSPTTKNSITQSVGAAEAGKPCHTQWYRDFRSIRKREEQ